MDRVLEFVDRPTILADVVDNPTVRLLVKLALRFFREIGVPPEPSGQVARMSLLRRRTAPQQFAEVSRPGVIQAELAVIPGSPSA